MGAKPYHISSRYKGMADSSKEWYSKSRQAWSAIPATENGVMNGFAHLSDADLDSSFSFLCKYFDFTLGGRALDCGCGMGRISSGLLEKHFEKVDLLEPIAHLLQKALGSLHEDKAGNVFPVGLESFECPTPSPGYRLVWLQWASLYLREAELVETLVQLRLSLLDCSSLIFLKENISDGDAIDSSDNSIMRSVESLQRIFDSAGLRVIAAQRDRCWSSVGSLYPVQMFVLGPRGAEGLL